MISYFRKSQVLVYKNQWTKVEGTKRPKKRQVDTGWHKIQSTRVFWTKVSESIRAP
jgi:hypothetical protein